MGFFAYGLLVVFNGALNAIGMSKRALIVSVARVLLVTTPVAWVGSRTLGPAGVFGADLLSGVAALLLAWQATASAPAANQAIR